MVISKRLFRIFIIATCLVSLLAGYFTNWALSALWSDHEIISPFVKQSQKKLPFLKYSFENLKKYEYQASSIVIEEILEQNDTYTKYLFSYRSANKKITGQLNVPTAVTPNNHRAIVMVRGYIPPEGYQTGDGTRNAAAYLAGQGYLTVAPDFLGFGGSDGTPEDSWEERLIKPINVIELIKSLRENDIEPSQNLSAKLPDSTSINLGQWNKAEAEARQLGIWAHSNGGQITLSVLEVLGQPIPTTLWAPVTAPFPYSVLFFSDQDADEGKAARIWVNEFERDYDVFEFSVTKHLDSLTGPLQIHHGDSDQQALIAWSNAFVDKVKEENTRRKELKESLLHSDASSASQATSPNQRLEPIKMTFFKYPGTDHNLSPNWNTAIERDSKFFAENL